MNKIKKPELLAPVGSMESLYAAVNNGCDAVYLGGKQFNARQYASNFTTEELQSALEYCHMREVKVYVTINTLYKQQELVPLLGFVEDLYQMGVDAVIVQDLGAAVYIKRNFPKMELHGSTQMTIQHLDGVRFLQSQGFERVVLSRELSLGEIQEIASETDMEIECFVHGALCVCYSGQCLMSSMIGGRSGNRGRCAQPCRLPYTLLQEEEGRSNRGQKGYLLSPKDIQTITILPDLIRAGIHSFKIEGRMKRPEYVAAVVSIYRKYIDLYMANPAGYSVDPKDFQILAQLFNRGGFSEGYYKQQSGKDMMSTEKPKNWGTYLGKVVQYHEKTGKCQIQTKAPLTPGDGIEIWTRKEPHPGTSISKQSKAGDIIQIYLKESIHVGDVVYKTHDKPLLDQLQKTYEKHSRRRSLEGELEAYIGEPMVCRLWDGEGNQIEVVGEQVEEAQNQPMSEEKILLQMQKMGNTPFQLERMDIRADKNIYIPIPQLNELRRRGTELLEQKILKRGLENPIKRSLVLPKIKGIKQKSPQALTILVHRPEAIERAAQEGVHRIYCEITPQLIKKLERYIELCHERNIEIYAALPRIYRKNTQAVYGRYMEVLQKSKIDGYLVRTYGQVEQMQHREKKIVADFSLNIFNSATFQVWEDRGSEAITLSPELNIKEVCEIGGEKGEAIIYGRLPLMVTQQCAAGNYIGQKEKHQPCTIKEKTTSFLLQDRMGEKFPLWRDCIQCISTIYNSQPIFVLHQLKEILQMPVGFFRLQFTTETDEQIADIVYSHMEKIRCIEKTSPRTERLLRTMQEAGYTKGHFFRGVE